MNAPMTAPVIEPDLAPGASTQAARRVRLRRQGEGA